MRCAATCKVSNLDTDKQHRLSESVKFAMMEMPHGLKTHHNNVHRCSF